jgi:predicted CXXCH cytochrome family protein
VNHFHFSSSYKIIVTLRFLLIGLVLCALILPVGAQAFQLPDPTITATATSLSPTPTATASALGTPTTQAAGFSSLSFPSDASQLASDRPLALLAGKLIFHGLVNASSCADGGMLNTGAASPCGESAAHNAVILWQNQFDPQIFAAAKEAGIPPFVLKNVFIKESQFWPATYHNPKYGGEYGLGHITFMGADLLLSWNRPFYKQLCNQNFNKETCAKEYVFQDPFLKESLRSVVLTSLNADCPTCSGGVDLQKARNSAEVTAAMLVANRNYIEWLVNGFSSSGQLSQKNVWRFTLASYNAGPGCFTNAFYITRGHGNPLSWKDVSQSLDGACKGSLGYVEFVLENMDAADPTALLLASTDTSLAARLVLGATPTDEPTATLTPTSTPVVDETQTAVPSTATPLPASVTPTPANTLPETPTDTSMLNGSETPTPTVIATDTPAVSSPTDLPVTATETPSPTATQVVAPTPTEMVQTVSEQLQSPHVQSELVLKIDPQNLQNVLQTLTALGVSLVQDSRHIESLDTLVIQVPPEQLNTVLDALQQSKGVEFAEPNYLVQLSSIPNDPYLPQQPGLSVMQIPQTWDALPSMQEVLVAVIDTGVDVSHPDLADAIWQNPGEMGLDANGRDKSSNGIDDDGNGKIDDWQGWNVVSNNNNVKDDQGHGTHLAGIIGAQMNNGIGIAGIAPNARILPIKALDKNGYGSYSQVAEAIVYATDMGARIIELGFGGLGSSELLQNAVDYAMSHGALVIAAAGNGGANTTYYPAAYSGVIAVGAVDNQLSWQTFSSTGEHISLVAPGIGIYSTVPGGSYAAFSGTSMSSAQVTGVAALLAGQPQFADTNLLRSALLNGAYDLGAAGRDPYYGFGVVHAFDALKYAGPVLPTPTPWIVPTSTPGGSGGVNIMSTQDLWALSQISTYPIYDAPGGTSPAVNSIDSAFNDNLSYSSGLFGGASTRRWRFTSFGDITDPSITSIWKTYLDVRFSVQGWTDDPYVIEINDGSGWSPFAVVTYNSTNPPPSTLITLSYDVTSLLNTPAKINNAQVQIRGITGALGGLGANGVADNVTFNFDEVRLRPVSEPPTPTPTPLFIPTSTLDARAITATPLANEPHNNFSSITTDKCASCHRTHTAKSFALRSATGEEQVCFACHTTSMSGTNVQPAFTNYSNTLTRIFKHDVANTLNIHLPQENIPASFSGANRHVECEDCHAPHSSSRASGSLTNAAPSVQQVMYQSTGVDPQWTALGAPTGFTWMPRAEREYQVCFKCHSSFTTLPTYLPDGYGWDGSSGTIGFVPNGLAKLDNSSASQVPDSRDLSKQFNSYQVSFHPLTALGRNSSMPAGSFVAGWSQNSMVYCTDCHTNPSPSIGAQGPHGSPLLHLLDGSADYITKIDPLDACNFVDGCPQIHSAGEICFKCHQYNTYATGTNPPTTTHFKNGTSNLHAGHSFAACYTCHNSHGSDQAHLINFDTSVVTIMPGYDSTTAWQWNESAGKGSCSVSCHGFSHGTPSPYIP